MASIPLGSVSRAIKRLSAGDMSAVALLWARYWDRLTTMARRMLKRTTVSGGDEEDVAQCVFLDVVTRISKHRVGNIANRRHLWRLMEVATHNQVKTMQRHDDRQKREANVVRLDAGVPESDDPSPSFSITRDDELEQIAQYVDDLAKNIAKLVLEGYGIMEISKQLRTTPRTIKRKLEAIKRAWIEHDVTFDVSVH